MKEIQINPINIMMTNNTNGRLKIELIKRLRQYKYLRFCLPSPERKQFVKEYILFLVEVKSLSE